MRRAPRTPEPVVEPRSLTIPAPAKVNLWLKVLGRRSDGFHELETCLQTLEMGDELTVAVRARRAPAPDVGLTLEGETRDVPADEAGLSLLMNPRRNRFCA